VVESGGVGSRASAWLFGYSRGDADCFDGGRAELESWVRSGTTEQRLVERAQVLLAATGTGSRAMAGELGCARRMVSKWRLRFGRDRVAGLADAPRSGKPRTYDKATDRRILAALDQLRATIDAFIEEPKTRPPCPRPRATAAIARGRHWPP
jgi:hypothetical protein